MGSEDLIPAQTPFARHTLSRSADTPRRISLVSSRTASPRPIPSCRYRAATAPIHLLAETRNRTRGRSTAEAISRQCAFVFHLASLSTGTSVDIVAPVNTGQPNHRTRSCSLQSNDSSFDSEESRPGPWSRSSQKLRLAPSLPRPHSSDSHDDQKSPSAVRVRHRSMVCHSRNRNRFAIPLDPASLTRAEAPARVTGPDSTPSTKPRSTDIAAGSTLRFRDGLESPTIPRDSP